MADKMFYVTSDQFENKEMGWGDIKLQLARLTGDPGESSPIVKVAIDEKGENYMSAKLKSHGSDQFVLENKISTGGDSKVMKSEVKGNIALERVFQQYVDMGYVADPIQWKE